MIWIIFLIINFTIKNVPEKIKIGDQEDRPSPFLPMQINFNLGLIYSLSFSNA